MERRQPAHVTSPSSRYGDQFLLNVVLASRDHVGIDYEEGAVERQLSGNLSFFIVDKRQFVAVPANFLDKDSFVASKDVPSIDYASVGVWILLEWLEWTFHVENVSGHSVSRAPEPRTRSARSRRPVVIGSDVDRLESPLFAERALKEHVTVAEDHVDHGGGTADDPVAGSLNERIRCVCHVASELLGRSVGPEEGRLLAFVDWAVEVASTTAEAKCLEVDATGKSGVQQKNETDFTDHDSAELRTSRQFFYLSFCHALCGEDGLLAGACRYRTRRSRDFARAFRCVEPPNYPSC
ncbi:hypothetical protein HPB51_003338 [Rhipicephalus microplus]|uniref:Uncharacterized protein n=1 Tax=Rhipicephalus microplus TaxID=6941 RepID=A0A9J6EWD8_RHIMP|nr:hypothetical protein HPB51_003338 [Rhipicephalus microplus]